jgi:hypothetical protein
MHSLLDSKIPALLRRPDAEFAAAMEQAHEIQQAKKPAMAGGTTPARVKRYLNIP